MKLRSGIHSYTHRQEFERILKQPDHKDLRPCFQCNKRCPCCQSTSCTCQCGPECVHAKTMMSSDPILYPIEDAIIPLVFEINALRVCSSYWSCEGHALASGEIFRVPQVWFYSDSIAYPKLITTYVASKKTTYPWRVCLVHTDDINDTGFSLEPNLSSIHSPMLKALQKDVAVISNGMSQGIKLMVRGFLHDSESASPGNDIRV